MRKKVVLKYNDKKYKIDLPFDFNEVVFIIENTIDKLYVDNVYRPEYLEVAMWVNMLLVRNNELPLDNESYVDLNEIYKIIQANRNILYKHEQIREIYDLILEKADYLKKKSRFDDVFVGITKLINEIQKQVDSFSEDGLNQIVKSLSKLEDITPESLVKAFYNIKNELNK